MTPGNCGAGVVRPKLAPQHQAAPVSVSPHDSPVPALIAAKPTFVTVTTMPAPMSWSTPRESITWPCATTFVAPAKAPVMTAADTPGVRSWSTVAMPTSPARQAIVRG